MRRVGMRRGTTPIAPQGRRAARWERWQDSQRVAVVQRAHGRCERCGCPGTDWHHVFSRRLLSEPLASHAAMTVLLCHEPHHLACHGTPDDQLVTKLRWAAIQRCLDLWPVPLVGIDNPVDAARAIERAVLADLTAQVADLLH